MLRRLGLGVGALLLLAALTSIGVHYGQVGKYNKAIARADRLRLGMTMDEVENIMGPPEKTWAKRDPQGRLTVNKQFAHVSLGLVEFVLWFAEGRDSLSGGGWDGVQKL